MRLLTTLVLGIILVPSLAIGQSEYVYPGFKKEAKRHQMIAVLPWEFKTTLREEDAAQVTQEEIAEMQYLDGLAFQQDVYDFFMKKGMKVEVQDVTETNRILEENGVDLGDIGEYKHKDLAEMLQVDALVSGNLKTSQPLSDKAATAVKVLTLGGAFMGTKGHDATGVMRITNQLGNQMWRYSIAKTSSNGDAMITSIMKKCSRNIPYM